MRTTTIEEQTTIATMAAMLMAGGSFSTPEYAVRTARAILAEVQAEPVPVQDGNSKRDYGSSNGRSRILDRI